MRRRGRGGIETRVGRRAFLVIDGIGGQCGQSLVRTDVVSGRLFQLIDGELQMLGFRLAETNG